ncbi:MAG: UDP-N-acetylglucosamine 2-epimerase (non-hydrolyzing) [Bryobacteraceae bacterium]|nr:UDP-N-acetylglucosamine 2-epimerase (non-hydrolyzing) [Bryobacteraceae bacterium]
MKILHVVGARPNFMKMAPLMHELQRRGDSCRQILIHTGQHYDQKMSDVFFRELGMPEPDINLEVGSGTHAAQTAQIMMRFEPVLTEHRPDWVVVPGDVNSTLACALVAVKLGFRVAHVEAGLRSFDRTMPEEINRILTDQISDLLFTPSADADENLRREGVAEEKIRLVGNLMIDTLVRLLPQAEEAWPAVRAGFGVEGQYGMVTLHRPSNVDDAGVLGGLVESLNRVAEEIPLVFPVHPRTAHRLAGVSERVRLVEPLGYLAFLAAQRNATVVITDSGGIQEETTFLGVPCLTLRENTERPVTITHGTNRLVRVGEDMAKIVRFALSEKKSRAPVPLWDGRAAVRAADALLSESLRAKGA